jgi:protocatechuate 3,4-dioxygenase beta subunit
MKTKLNHSIIPQSFHLPLGRRRFLKSLACVSGSFALPGYLAEALTIAPSLTQGPYYPLANNIPLDKDNDLLFLNDSLTRASGKISYLSGRVLTSDGNPIKGALVEIWHADNGGNYIYSAAASRNPAADPNFQGFGQFLTGSSGQYKFRTVKAGLYTGRTRHFHLAVTIPGQLTRYCTQLFWNETAYVTDSNGNDTSTVWPLQNSGDSIFASLTADQKAAVNLNYTTVDATVGAVAANFDFVVGLTPIEPVYPGGGLLIAGAPVAGPTNTRFKITLPAVANYTYEVYGNPTLANVGNTITNWQAPYLTNMSWAALPFSLTQTGDINANKITATNDGLLNLYLEEKAVKGFYYVSFRLPGANTGTP